VAGLTAVNPFTGATDPLMVQMADQTGMKAMHMFTAGDPARNPTFALFADASYFITDFPTSTCETCSNPAFAWNHGDIQKEIGQTWVGFVGPGVLAQPDQTVFTDHTDLRSTINALVGLRDGYPSDGRVITQALAAGAIPAALGADQPSVERLGSLYKQGQSARGVLLARSPRRDLSGAVNGS